MRLAAHLCTLVLAFVLSGICADRLEEGFGNPPMSARPAIYYLLLNGYVNRDYVDKELQAYKDAGVGGLCVFDMGARGAPSTVPPAGPAFLSPESVANLSHIIRTAGRLGMDVSLSVSSSWDMGGSWVKPENGSMTLISSEIRVTGPRDFAGALPFPKVPENTPKGADGRPLFFRNVAVLAIPNAQRRSGWEFVFELPDGTERIVDHLALYNGASDAAKEFTVAVSDSGTDAADFHDVVSGTLEAHDGAQQFRFPRTRAKYVRLVIRSAYNPKGDRVELAEFELYTPDGTNVLLSHSAKRTSDGPRLLRFSSEAGSLNDWSANNINDGRKSGARGSWASAGPPPLAIEDSRRIVDLTSSLDRDGRLRWKAPPGEWTIIRYVATNTGEHLKVPSPNSDGLATDHLSTGATQRCLRYVLDRLRTGLPDLKGSALKSLYLASYEVQGQIWTPDFLEQFEARRGYSLKPFLPVLRGGLVDNEQVTDRVRYDFEKTLGEMLVDNYYRAAGVVAHEAGLQVESEAGGPGPPIHRVPVDALLALGAVDVVRGEFWPYRPEARSMWVVKETATAAHIYGKPLVNMEAFTSSHHWQEGPAFLKAAADRAFTEGMNHVVWHTASHQPPEAGKPGWVYGAGTHMSQNRPWWPMMKPFLDYLGRTSFLLQQGRFIADVLYYYGDQGFNFVMPKHVNPSLGPGYDYDITNEDVLLHRLSVKDGKLTLPDGMEYEVLVLPERDDIDLPALRRLEALVRDGATVVGARPRRSVGYKDYLRNDSEVVALAGKLWGSCDGQSVLSHQYGKGRIVCGGSLRHLLQERGVRPDFTYRGRLPDTELDFIHRSAAGAEIYFLRNKRRRQEFVEATFRVSEKQPEIWDPASGDIRPWRLFNTNADGTTTLSLEFAPEESMFVVFRTPPVRAGIVAVQHSGWVDAVDWKSGVAFENGTYDLRFADSKHKSVQVTGLPGPRTIGTDWTVRFVDGQGAPPVTKFPKLISWTESSDPGIRYYSGIAEYAAQFAIRQEDIRPNRRIYIDLGRLWAAGEVRVNGRPVGIVWKAPYRVDVTSVVRAGSNSLEVRVANDWANRLIGDARDPTGKHYTRTNIVRTSPEGTPWAQVDLIPSGLFGPVVLSVGEVIFK